MKSSFIRFAVCAFIVTSSTRLQAATPPKPSPKLTPAETKAAAILREVENASKKYRTMTANFEGFVLGKLTTKGSLRAMKPNLVFLTYKYASGSHNRQQIIVNDGMYKWDYPTSYDENSYSRFKLEPAGSNFVGLSRAGVALDIFFNLPLWMKTYSLTQRFKLIGTQKVSGSVCRILQHQEIQPGWENKKFRVVITLFVNRDNVVQRVVNRSYDIIDGKQINVGFHENFVISNIKLNVPMTAAQFKWKPPVGAVQSN